MVFGDNGKCKKIMFEKLILFIVFIMLVVSILGIFVIVIGVFSNL